MREFGQVEATKFYLDLELDRTGTFTERKIKPQNPSNRWHAAIVRESYCLSKFAERSALRAVKIYQNQVKTEAETDGRVINPANPVQLSGGILDAIELLEAVETTLKTIETQMEYYDCKASFKTSDRYQEAAKIGLNYSRTIIPRVRLFIHTYLWILWTQEALRQANQFGAQLRNDNNFEHVSESAFPFISHPPLIVATIACSTMIEEVGAKYINAVIDGEPHPPDQTSAGPILSDLENYYPESAILILL